jgi:subtilisin family serine protease
MRISGPTKYLVVAGLALVTAGAAAAQLLPQLPDPGGVLGGIGRTAADALDRTGRTADDLTRQARGLAGARSDRLRAMVDAHPDILEMTDGGPAVRGQIIALDPSPATIAVARGAGYRIVAEEEIEGLGLRSVTLEAPGGLSLRRALSQLRRIAPDGAFTANHLHDQSGAAEVAGPVLAGAALAANGGGSGPAIGMIDGGVAAHPALPGPIEQRGFAEGAPAASAHGTAVASLAAGRGLINGAAPGTRLLVADVYGRDPAGGSAMAIARALGWMAERRVPVVAVSLVGPSNALVERAVAQARARGVHIVAAVGNDGPAAPPAYPASYPGVIAVTGIDGRNRALIEAGRALRLDYAAPGADMAAADPSGGRRSVRGTSYAVPFVAARAWRAITGGRAPIAALDAEAVDLPPRGADRHFGRGLVCADCRTRM